MKKILNISLIAIICMSTVACSSLRFPGVYRLKVVQGNFIEKDMIDQLEVGMTRKQVRYVMGTALVQDTFSPDRWDYFFSVRSGDKEARFYHFKIFFEGDSLASWDGNYEQGKATTDTETMEEAEKTTKQKDDAKFKKNDDVRF